MAQAAEQSLGQRFVAQEGSPVVVMEICGQDCCPLFSVALLHHFEKDVGLLRPDVEVADFVDDDDGVDATIPTQAAQYNKSYPSCNPGPPSLAGLHTNG